MSSATKNSFWYLVFNFSRMGILFAGNIWISRILGPESFGQFSYILSIIIYISSADSLCHESIVKQALSENKDLGMTMGSAFLLCSMLATLSCFAIGLFGFFAIEDKFLLAALFWLVPGLISKPFNPIANYFDIHLLSKLSSFALFVGSLASILFRAIGVNFNSSLSVQSFGYSLQGIVYSAVLLFLFRKKIPKLKWTYSFEVVKSIFKKSFPLFLSTLLYLSLSQSDIFMINHMLSVRDVGIYAVVVKFSEPWVIVSSALCTTYFSLVFAQKSNEVKRNKYFVRANWFSNAFVLVLGLVLSLCMPLIVNSFLGQQYEEVTTVFRIYFWGILFLFYANIQHIWEVFNQHYSIALKKILWACAIKITLNYILGSQFGLVGFAISSVVALSFYGIGFNFINPITNKYLGRQLNSFSIWQTQIMVKWFKFRIKKWIK